MSDNKKGGALSEGNYFMKPIEIDESEWTKKEASVPFRKKLVRQVSGTNFFLYQDLLNNLVNWLVLFIYIQYLSDLKKFKTYTWFIYYQIAIHSYFLLDFSVRLVCAKYPKRQLGSLCSMIELLTTIPFFGIYFVVSQNDIDNVWLRMSFMLDTSRVYLTVRIIDHFTTDNLREILHIVNILITIIFFPAAICSFIESWEDYPEFERENTTFFQMVYFVFISMTFIGYGSQVESEFGKIMLILFLVVAMIVLPAQAGKLMSLFAAKSPWARAKFEKISKDVPHLIILGQVCPSNLKNFLDEFFHEDHEGSKKQCVVIQNCRPSNAILDIIGCKDYAQQVIYLEGDQRDATSMKRADISRAEAVMILNDKLSFDASHADTEIILQAMFIKNYLLQNGENVNICMQLLKPESSLNYHLSLDAEVVKKDQIVCIEQMKFSLMAKSCLCPGLVTLISNIIQSSGDPSEEL